MFYKKMLIKRFLGCHLKKEIRLFSKKRSSTYSQITCSGPLRALPFLFPHPNSFTSRSFAYEISPKSLQLDSLPVVDARTLRKTHGSSAESVPRSLHSTTTHHHHQLVSFSEPFARLFEARSGWPSALDGLRGHVCLQWPGFN